MAQYALRLRRAIPLASSILTHQPPSLFSIISPAIQQPPKPSLSPQNSNPTATPFPFQSRSFRSTGTLLSSRPSSRRSSRSNFDREASIFPGRDYKHWVIGIDFPKDPQLSDEEMVETYVQTAAQVLGSREEAMKKIYACSTTNYTGFHIQVTEEEAKKFMGLPGVVHIFPDCYIDPINKDYGGDKYENGVITPRRPHPFMHGRQ